jgi:hypothetical protein
VTCPELFNVPVPSCVLPSENVTVPVGVPLPDAAATVALNATLPPAVTVVGVAVSVTVVADGGATDVLVDG